MSKIESKIKDADGLIIALHPISTAYLFGRQQVIDLIQAAQRQAIEATLEVGEALRKQLLDKKASKNNSIDLNAYAIGLNELHKALKDSPELKVI